MNWFSLQHNKMHRLQIVACTLIVALLLVNVVDARPNNGSPINSLTRPCNSDAIMQENCQKCAKITKSPKVYPMCCNDEDGVYSWCERYINYGIH